MRWQWSVLSVLVLAAPGFAQEAMPKLVGVGEPAPIQADTFSPSPVFYDGPATANQGGFLTGDRCFPNFIGFVSNPTFSIDPRALTQMWPVFANTWTSSFGPLAGGDIQVYGPGISIALSDRLAVGANRGGYVVSHLRRAREGFLNLGGFAQYTLIRDVPNQFLFTAGLQVEAPTGEADVFQGHGPAYLTPYFTFGKEFGNFHVLGTTGYNCPAGSGKSTTDTYYANVHFDVRTFGWLYPLVEFNGAWTSTTIDLKGPELPGFFDLDQHTAAGGIVTVAPGFNAVLIHDRLEVGMVYQTPIWSQRNLHFDEVLMKVILRY